MFKRIDHIEMIPTDIEKTLRFYTEIFHFKIKSRNSVFSPPLEEVIFLELGDTLLELLKVSNPEPPSIHSFQSGYKTMAIEVSNMAEAIDYLKDQEIPITWGPVNLGKSIRAELKDPDGLAIELRQYL